jgi:hypothetical protein
MMGDDQASTIYTAQADLGSSMDEADLATVPYQAAPGGVAAADAGAPPLAPGGIPHRWKVVSMMAASFVLCNMDKVNCCCCNNALQLAACDAAPGLLADDARCCCTAFHTAVVLHVLLAWAATAFMAPAPRLHLQATADAATCCPRTASQPSGAISLLPFPHGGSIG